MNKVVKDSDDRKIFIDKMIGNHFNRSQYNLLL